MKNVEQARETADYAHAMQTRKGSGEPYSNHCHAVADIVAQYTDNKNAIIAAELHDVLEDVPESRYSESQMLQDFGKEATDLVKMVSEDKRADDKIKKTWQDRKDSYINHLLKSSNRDALIIATADKINNLQSMLYDYQQIGEQLWTRFNAPKEKQLWYYKTILGILHDKNLPDDLINCLSEQINQLQKIVDKHNSK